MWPEWRTKLVAVGSNQAGRRKEERGAEGRRGSERERERGEQA